MISGAGAHKNLRRVPLKTAHCAGCPPVKNSLYCHDQMKDLTCGQLFTHLATFPLAVCARPRMPCTNKMAAQTMGGGGENGYWVQTRKSGSICKIDLPKGLQEVIL